MRFRLLRRVVFGFVVTMIAAIEISSNRQAAARAVGAIIAADEGERRYFPGSNRPVFLKIDPRNGNSQHLTVGEEIIEPGGFIPVHRHVMMEEVIFVHRGTASIYLAGRRQVVQEGAMVFVPANTQIGIQNTGSTPMDMVYFFNEPGFEQRLRARTQTAEERDKKLPAVTPAELEVLNKRYGVEYFPEIPIVLPAPKS